MKRRLFTFLSAVSLLLSAVVVVLWVRSYWVADEIALVRDRRWSFFSLQGRLSVYIHATYGGAPGQPPSLLSARDGEASVTISFRAQSPDDFWYAHMEDEWFSYHYQETPGRGVFHGQTQVWGERAHSYYVTLPHWLAVLITGLPPIGGMIVHYATRKVKRNGCCAACGYDLRATPGRCPECGTVSAQVTEAQKETTK